MRFADDRKSSWLWGVTLILALILAGIFVWMRRGEMPLLLSLSSQRGASEIADCLTSPAAGRLLGRMRKVPVRNLLVGRSRWLSGHNSLHLTSPGHKITIHFVDRPSLVRVYGHERLSGDQANLLRNCTDARSRFTFVSDD